MKKKIIIIFGPQGSGKGTQAEILSKNLSLPHISTGELFRAAIKKKNKPQGEIAEIINKGKLVSDELTFQLLQERLSKKDCQGGFILDGYPRTIKQAELLDNRFKIDKVIEIDISDKESIKRLVNRRQDPITGKIYNLYTVPKPSSRIKGRLVQRKDDRKRAIKKRLKNYHKNTKQILKYYKNKAVRINGEQDIKRVALDIAKIV